MSRPTEGNPEATRALAGLSLAELVTVCEALRAGTPLGRLVVDLRVTALIPENQGTGAL